MVTVYIMLCISILWVVGWSFYSVFLSVSSDLDDVCSVFFDSVGASTNAPIKK